MKVVLYGDPILRSVCKPVIAITDTLRMTIANMIETIAEHQGVGLAAPQVGMSERFVVIDPRLMDRTEEVIVMINPEIRESDGSNVFREGCLSLPGIEAEIRRPAAVTVSYTDMDNLSQTKRFIGVKARIVQHEIDHGFDRRRGHHASRRRGGGPRIRP